jgi:sialate O-acetylesterase
VKRSILLVSALLLFACSKQQAAPGDVKFVSNSVIEVASSLKSDMVLQQNTVFNIRGKGTPGEPLRITCSWESTPHIINVAGDGSWVQPVNTPAGGPDAVTIKIEGKYVKTFNNILIGEVWICAGQSNMQMALKSTTGGTDEAASANYPKIRLLNMTKKTASTPQESFDAEWIPCVPSTAGDFSAAGYYFGQKLFGELNVPVGLISSNWGNTGIEVWMSSQSVSGDSELAADASTRSAGHTDGSPTVPGSAYNAMIYPLKDIPVAGVIWYQGENNQGSPYIYPKFLKTMIDGWRGLWGIQFPVYIAQIAPYQRLWNYTTYYSNPAMRFSQAEATKTITGTAIEVNDDIVGDITDIHPKNKKDVGARLASLALGQTYNRQTYKSFKCPIYKEITISGNKITVSFNFAENGLKTTDGASPTLFEICGADRVFYPAAAKISGSTVELSSSSVPVPVAARMGWSYTKVTNLRSANDLPVSVFKTYQWADPAEEN